MDIQVGDRVTYRYKEECEIFIRIIETNSDIKIILEDDKEILKIERPKYAVIEGNKKLLTAKNKLNNLIKNANIEDIDMNDILQTEEIEAIKTILKALENSISKDKIKEKIGELEKIKLEKDNILDKLNIIIQNQNGTETDLDSAYQYYDETFDEKQKIINQINILQELLGDDK